MLRMVCGYSGINLCHLRSVSVRTLFVSARSYEQSDKPKLVEPVKQSHPATSQPNEEDHLSTLLQNASIGVINQEQKDESFKNAVFSHTSDLAQEESGSQQENGEENYLNTLNKDMTHGGLNAEVDSEKKYNTCEHTELAVFASNTDMTINELKQHAADMNLCVEEAVLQDQDLSLEEKRRYLEARLDAKEIEERCITPKYSQEMNTLASLRTGSKKKGKIRKKGAGTQKKTTSTYVSPVLCSLEIVDSSGDLLSQLTPCLGNDALENRQMNLMKVKSKEIPSASYGHTKSNKDEQISRLLAAFPSNPELQAFPRLRTFLVGRGHKEKTKKLVRTKTLAKTKEKESAQTVIDVFNEPPLFSTFEYHDELIVDDELYSENRTHQYHAFEVEGEQKWKFPVDNQYDIKEDKYSFGDHVFLDHHLDDFPQVEQVQQFMELVITGLQQNPFLSYNKKVDRILWYKKYFSKLDKDLF